METVCEQRISRGGCRETFAVLTDLTKSDNANLPAEPSADLENKFATFFRKKIETIREDIKATSEFVSIHSDIHQEPALTENVLTNLRAVDVTETRRLFRVSNNNTCGLDTCPTILLNESLEAHLPTVLDIFNSSLKQGVFPDLFMQADVTPILRKYGLDSQQLSNYRPISNLPFLSKLLERVVADRLLNHIEHLNLGETFQSAYKLHHSTESALIHIQSDISDALDKNCGVMLAMIDLSAAFDTVDQTIFIKLLHDRFAVRGTALDWFRSYLSERQFCLKFGSVISEPQGSVLGPIIFNMCTTPLERIIHRHNLCYHKYDMEIYGEYDPSSNCDCLRIRHQLQACFLDEIRAGMLT